MNIIQAIVLGLIQGATEFIPISSSAHLVLVPWALGWPSPGLAFDTIVHWGTLSAVVAYFWGDLWRIARAWFSTLPTLFRTRRLDDIGARMAWWIVIGTLPAAVVGALFNDFFESLFSSPQTVAAFLLVTATVLVTTELVGARVRSVERMNAADAVIIGLAQAVAIAPGISRSGATIAAGLARGLRREAAARFSFVLSIPIIFGAGLMQLKDLVTTPGALLQAPILVVGFLVAAASGYLCIRFLLRYLQRGRLYVFAAYCALVGAAVLIAIALR
ncbi:MAG: undecaprenyl-diphosphatase UppP [Anaerolineae bacterium]|nr:undecaprenyl-diphosphatase UppP [Anaerolineae bacterium]